MRVQLICAAVFALGATPSASACITGSLMRVALSPAPPADIERGEVVLEVVPDSNVVLGDSQVRFNVARVVSGKFDSPVVTISYLPTSCHSLGLRPDAVFVAGRPRGDDGVLLARMQPLHQTRSLRSMATRSEQVD